MKLLQSIKENWISGFVLLVGLIFVVNLFDGFNKLDLLWKSKTQNSLVTDKDKWQTWLNRNTDLFASLKDGAKIGITKDFKSDYGLIWTKLNDRILVEQTNQLRKVGPGIILEFDDQVTKDLQWKKNRDEAVIFLRHRSQIGKIQAYYLKKEEKLQSEGFVTLLQEIGLRPVPATKKDS